MGQQVKAIAQIAPEIRSLGQQDQRFRGGLFEQPAVFIGVVRAVVTSQEAPRWEFIAARLLNARFDRSLEEQLRKRGIGGLYDKLRRLTDEGLYGEYILATSGTGAS